MYVLANNAQDHKIKKKKGKKLSVTFVVMTQCHGFEHIMVVWTGNIMRRTDLIVARDVGCLCQTPGITLFCKRLL